MKANTNSNERYFSMTFNFDGIERGTKEWFEAVIKSGYTYMYRWINSDEEWCFFATNEARAVQGAVELYAKEKGYDEKKARQYYGDTVDVYEVKGYINDVF